MADDFDYARVAKEIKETLPQVPILLLPVAYGGTRYVERVEDSFKGAGLTYTTLPIKHTYSTKEESGIRRIKTPIKRLERSLKHVRSHERHAIIFDDDIHKGSSILGALCYVADNIEELGVERIWTHVLSDVLGVANFACEKLYQTFIGPHQLLAQKAPNKYNGYKASGILEKIENGCYGAQAMYFKWLSHSKHRPGAHGMDLIRDIG